MKIKVPYNQWKKIKHELKLKKLDPHINYKGQITHNYVLHFGKRLYPRFHFVTKAQYKGKYKPHEINIHIDWVKHIASDGSHELIDNLVKKILLIK